MGLRTFRDDEGRRWRVWRVATPAARAHLVETGYQDGWLVFEREDGSERRRLTEVPDDWTSFGDSQLARLCQRAASVGSGRGTTGTRPAERLEATRG